MPEGGIFRGAVDQVAVAGTEFAQHAARMCAFEDAVVAGVGHVEVVLAHGQARREGQRQPRLRTEPARRSGLQHGATDFLDQGVDGRLQPRGLVVAGE